MIRSVLAAGVAPAARVRHVLHGAGPVALLALTLAGCGFDRDATGSVGGASGRGSADAPMAELSRRYDANPSDPTTGLAYARALRTEDRNAQAVAVLETVAIKRPFDRAVLAAYGKALNDVGRAKEAAAVLERAHTPDRPDWTVLSAQGSSADQLGDHRAAQDYYAAALRIAPANPHVLSNLGLSYALDGQLPLAEQTLRGAAAAPGADMRVRQNLALVLALQGKSKEARAVAETDLSPADASAGVAAIERMIAQSTTWQGVRKPVGRRGSGAKGAASDG